METTFKLTIRTPDQDIFNAEVDGVRLSTEGGEMEIYANHASLTGTILFSPVVVKTIDGKEEGYIARNGIFLFDNESNTATLLALHCEHKSEVSLKTVKEYSEFIQQQLAEGKDLSSFEILYLEGEKLAVEEQIKEME